ncbi:MAG TPA: hypothetical protein VH138_04875 [Vicinamibacterales bacterium]|nr:hypothetical protein [Vicinamibacterales bacterium]
MGGDYLFRHGRHDVTIGGDAKHIGIDVADFILGIPATSTIGTAIRRPI